MTREHAPISFFAEIQVRDETFRHECEVRWIASFDTDAHRSVYLERVWDKRGEITAKRLREDVWAHMEANGLVVQPQQESLFA